jgi:hypothetical protein
MTGPLEIARGAILGFSKRAVLIDADDNRVMFDTTEDFLRGWPGSATERPIEDETTVSDHVVKKQQTITFKALLNANGINPISSLLGTGLTERADQLIKWRDETTYPLRLLWTEQIDNLVIESMSEPKENMKNARLFNITIKRLKVAVANIDSHLGEGSNPPKDVVTPQ